MRIRKGANQMNAKREWTNFFFIQQGLNNIQCVHTQNSVVVIIISKERKNLDCKKIVYMMHCV